MNWQRNLAIRTIEAELDLDPSQKHPEASSNAELDEALSRLTEKWGAWKVDFHGFNENGVHEVRISPSSIGGWGKEVHIPTQTLRSSKRPTPSRIHTSLLWFNVDSGKYEDF